MTDKARALIAAMNEVLADGCKIPDTMAYRIAADSALAALRTAPGVDLEQFRDAMKRAIDVLRYATHPHRSPHADELAAMLAKVDSQGTASAVPEGWVRLADIDPRDLQVECYPSASESSFSFRVPKGVKITHKSGAAVICDTERSMHANRDKAMRGISAMLAAAQEPSHD